MKDSKWLEDITNEHVKALTPYASARRLFAASEGQSRIWLNANESPESSQYGLSSELFNRYPDCQPQGVLDAYAAYSQLSPEQITITRGADEGIELLIRAFCKSAKDAILICPPTYGMYAISADTFNIKKKKAPLLTDFSLDIASINAHVDQVKVVFICSPNNPTGTSVSEQDIETILQAYSNKGIVVVDEAYIEFSAQDTKQSLLKTYPNLVILRTLSKGFALAGIRCGFVLSSAQIKQVLLKVIAPYPVADPVAQIASQALSETGLACMRERVNTLNTALAGMTGALNRLPDVEVMGSQCGNFVLFRSQYNKSLMQYLVKHNVLIRDQSSQYLLDDCLRISIGTEAENQALLSLIKQFFAQAQAPNQEAAS